MKKMIVIGMVGLLFFGCSPSTIQKDQTSASDVAIYHPTGPKQRVFISEFENRTTYGQRRLGAGISNMLATELSKTGGFILLEREKLDVILKEQALGLSGVISEKSAPQIGELLGANAIITGAVTQFGVRTEAQDLVITASKKQIATCTVDLRLIDVSTGRVLWAGSGAGTAVRKYTNYLGSGTAGSYDEMLESDAFRSAVVNVMQNLLQGFEKLEWSCVVAKVSGDKVYLNAGQNSHLEIGTPLTIYRQGEPITDPVTGAEIGREINKVGSGQVSGYFGDDGSIMNLIEGNGISVGDICKLK
ncbi:MAG: CsgG/HfaB family protein [Candidatus Marinimicrobia bacterium]|nr:CsgG/HfaB family protein [Candidatus Neomarinimicrobiota bacterium]